MRRIAIDDTPAQRALRGRPGWALRVSHALEATELRWRRREWRWRDAQERNAAYAAQHCDGPADA